MRFKIIVTDLDETLVIRHSDVTEHAISCIKEFQNKGGIFVVASGRPLCQITPNLKRWGIKADIIIAFNGSEIYFVDKEKTYSYFIMKAEWVKEVIDLMRPFDLNLNIVVDGKNVFSKKVSDEYVELYNRIGQEICYRSEEFFYRDTPKLMFRLNDDSNMEEIEKYIDKHPSNEYKGFKTGPHIVEFTNSKVSKGFALKEICRMSNIDISETVAIGDTSNDNDMLIESGLGVCLLNGSDDTKSIADVITEKTCEDDGWADFVEKYVLPYV